MTNDAPVEPALNENATAIVEYHPIANCWRLLEGTEFDEFVADVQAKGLIESILLHPDGSILDGRNRYRACLAAGVEPHFRTWRGDCSMVALIALLKSLNDVRRHDNESQRAMTAARLANMTEGRPSKTAQIQAVSQSEAADQMDVSRSSVQSAAKVQSFGTPDLIDAVDAGRVSVSAAAEVASQSVEVQNEIIARGEKEILKAAAAIRSDRREANKSKRQKTASRIVDPPAGVYDVVVIDPPWPVEKVERDERPNQTGLDYPTLTIEQISEIEIPAAEDCHLWLWTTHKFLPDALDILGRWGFRYVCTFVWHKPGGFQPFGLPQYNCEFVVYARKGSPKFIDTKAFPVCFNAPRGAHSEKPEEFYGIVRRVTDGERIDMFNRREIEGFERWGNEV